MKHPVARSGILVAALFSTLSPAYAKPPMQPVEIRFDARVGTEPARCGQAYTNIGTAKAGMQFQDMRIYVSTVKLIDAKGHEVPVELTPDEQWQSDQVALLDFEDRTGNCNGNPGTNMVVRGTVPEGTYSGLTFEIGVPQAVNHQDPTLAAAPLNVTGLTWPWRAGYKFTTIDLETSGGAGGPNAATGFSIHIGSTDCGDGPLMKAPNAPCKVSNRSSYRLDGFNPASSRVVLDFAALLAGTDITVNAPHTASGCMSGPDPDCAAIFDQLGLTFEGKQSTGQKWVRVE